MISKTKLGQLLVDSKIITSEQLTKAHAGSSGPSEMLGLLCSGWGLWKKEAIYMPILAQQIGVEFANLKSLNIPMEAIGEFPPNWRAIIKSCQCDWKIIRYR